MYFIQYFTRRYDTVADVANLKRDDNMESVSIVVCVASGTYWKEGESWFEYPEMGWSKSILSEKLKLYRVFQKSHAGKETTFFRAKIKATLLYNPHTETDLLLKIDFFFYKIDLIFCMTPPIGLMLPWRVFRTADKWGALNENG